MSLTVPRSGSIAGRSANLQVAPAASQAAQVVADFASTVTRVGIGLEQDRLQREASRVQVDMARDMNNLALDLRQIGDPDELDRRWAEGSAAIRASYLDGTGEDGRPRVSTANRDRVGLAFDDLSGRMAYSVGARAIDLRMSQREAQWLDTRHTLTQAAATGDAATRDYLFGLATQQLDEMVAAGIITPAEAAERRLSLQGDTTNAIAIRMAADDPDALLAAIADGQMNDLPAEVQAQYAVAAQASIDRRAAAELDAAEDAQRAYIAGETAWLGEIAGIAGTVGDVPVDYARLQRAVDARIPGAAEAMAAVELAQVEPDFRQMTPATLRALIAEERAGTFDERWQTERLQVLEDALATAEAGWARDPWAFAATVGMDVPALALDPANPDAFAASLAARAAGAQALVDQHYIRHPVVFTEAERAAVTALVATDQEPGARAAIATALVANLPRSGPDSASAILDPVTAHMGTLVATGTPPALAEEVFRGQQAIAAGNVIPPTGREILETAGITLARIWGDVQRGEQERAAVQQATAALYAARVRQSDPDGETPISEEGSLNQTIYLQALHEVLGGSGNYDSDNALGGIMDIGGFPIVLPRGMRAGDVQDAWDVLTNNRHLTPETAETAFSLASLSGAPPAYAGGMAGLLEDLPGARLQAVSEGEYIITFPLNGGNRVLTDVNGNRYSFSLNRLVGVLAP